MKDGHVARDLRFYHPLYAKPCHTLKLKFVKPSLIHFALPNRCFQSRTNKKWSRNSADQIRSDYINVESSSSESLNLEVVPSSSDEVADISNYNCVNSFETSHVGLFVTALLLVICRVGYFIPLPGFDRRWWISLGFAILEAIIVASYSHPYSIYAASYRVRLVMVTAFLLVCGAMTMTWICDTISESGFGQGSSLIICVGILIGYSDTPYKMLTQLSGSVVSWWLYGLAILGVFSVVTMWAVVITEGCRKIKLQYYGFKLAYIR